MFGLSFTHLILVAVIGLIVIGPDQLPELARNIARFINEIKRNTDAFAKDFKDQVKVDPIRLDQPTQPKPTVENSPSATAPAISLEPHHHDDPAKKDG